MDVMPEKQLKNPEPKQEESKRYTTFVAVRSHKEKEIFLVKISSDNRLTGPGTKPADLKGAMMFPEKKGETLVAFALNKTWEQAQEIDPKEVKNLIKDKMPKPFSFSAEIALYRLKTKRGEEASHLVQPGYAPIGETESNIPLKTVPKKRNRS